MWNCLACMVYLFIDHIGQSGQSGSTAEYVNICSVQSKSLKFVGRVKVFFFFKLVTPVSRNYDWTRKRQYEQKHTLSKCQFPLVQKHFSFIFFNIRHSFLAYYNRANSPLPMYRRLFEIQIVSSTVCDRVQNRKRSLIWYF